MANKSHFNSGHFALNQLKKNGKEHSSAVADIEINKSLHSIFIEDAVKFLKKLPDASVQLILVDPPYNLDLDHWDTFENYLDWAKSWLDEIYRVLAELCNLWRLSIPRLEERRFIRNSPLYKTPHQPSFHKSRYLVL